MAPRVRVSRVGTKEETTKDKDPTTKIKKTYQIPKLTKPKEKVLISPLQSQEEYDSWHKQVTVLHQTKQKISDKKQSPLAKLFAAEEEKERRKHKKTRWQDTKKQQLEETEVQRKAYIQQQREREAQERKQYAAKNWKRGRS